MHLRFKGVRGIPSTKAFLKTFEGTAIAIVFFESVCGIAISLKVRLQLLGVVKIAGKSQ